MSGRNLKMESKYTATQAYNFTIFFEWAITF